MNKNIIILFGILVFFIIIYIYFQSQHFTNVDELDDSEYTIRVLNENPRIVYIYNFLNDKETNHLISYAKKNKRPSTIDTKDGGPVTLQTNVRSSNTAHVEKNADEIIKGIELKASNFANSDTYHLEPLQVVIYEKGQKYTPHYDFFSSDSPEMVYGGNRNKTILVYLNNLPDDAGGNTFFPKLNIRVKPSKGDAIYFENMNGGIVNWDTLHAGEELLSDTTKYALNMWFRQNPLYENS